MDTSAFWDLMERSARETGGPDERADWLTGRLATLPHTSIEDFQVLLDSLRNRVDTWRMWGAATLIFQGWCSDDSFWYFQLWLIGQGREMFERAAADPDALADAPAVRALAGRSRREWNDGEWPGWEKLDYVAGKAYGNADDLHSALRARAHLFRSSPAPEDDRTETDRRYPRLTALLAGPGT
ncbi:DUF4240 domain-containing protein [Actinoplanes sp. NPDC049599]|uniref:DUF4240 domain-containing protein n=1 Tax=Actinoplanes sp. NPDC049599 TaxID=3363903 RepID=UPI0037A4EF49